MYEPNKLFVEQKDDVDEVGKRLLRAADYIEKHGWCQRAYRCGPRVCAGSAIADACGEDEAAFNGAYDRMVAIIGTVTIPAWNDAPGRTKEQVIEAMKAAARHV